MANWPKVEASSRLYPKRLRRLKDPPRVIYYQGEWRRELFKRCLAVVGTRRMTDYGQIVLERLIPPLIQAGVTIVSGFMYGVDAAAHQLCLDLGGRTIAVLGCGLSQTVPENQTELRQKIVTQGGLVITELPPEHKAFPWTFVRRNRIIAGLSQAVLVIEAGLKSGALITAKRAFELKRPVLAVPGPITSGVSAGCNWLIQQGAKLVTRGEEVIKLAKFEILNSKFETSPKSKISNPKLKGQSKLSQEILQLLAEAPRTADELARELNQPVATITSQLTLLHLQGQIREMGGRWMVKN